ncbi:MAG: methionyl-tRNA formyltransferase [Chlamydiia bacterium]|nr:methionyl-tRNA formyltransferase [Chlamydiia bacterium]
MRIVFFGTPHVAEIVLNYLIDQNIEIVGIVTRPDKPKGRSQKMQPPPVKSCAEKRLINVPIFQPTRASTPEFCEILKSLNADLFVVVAYGEIIKQMLLDLPPKGCINVHFSQLPRWRGAAPMQHTLLHGDKETGVSIIEMVLALDAGAVLGEVKIPVPEDMTCGELSSKLCELSGPLLIDVIKKIENNTIKPQPQDDAYVTLAPKITPEMCKIDWSRSARDIHNQVRALSPHPGAWTMVEVQGQPKRLKILRTRISEAQPSYSKAGWYIQTGQGVIEILELQLEGKKPLSIKNFIAGISQVSLL